MGLSRIFAAVLLAATIALPATAAASPHGAKRSATTHAKVATVTPLALAATVARSSWGAVPCRGGVKVVAQRPLHAGAGEATDAWVTFSSPLGANNLAAPADTYTDCTISFAGSRWPTQDSMREDWDVLCMTMVHEMGHLLGHAHDEAPGSVMAPVFTDLSSEPAACRATRPARAS